MSSSAAKGLIWDGLELKFILNKINQHYWCYTAQTLFFPKLIKTVYCKQEAENSNLLPRHAVYTSKHIMMEAGYCSVLISSVHQCLISQIIQLGAQFSLNIFIYTSSLHVAGIQVPIIRRKLLYLCDTGIFHSVWVASGPLVGLFQSNQQTRRHPYRVTNTSFA